MSTLIIILIVCNADLMHVRSVPISIRDTTQDTVHWVDGPNTRGTFELTLSCVLTLLLCMWTSLHLNIPLQGETVLQQFKTKFLWTLLALFAPEIVVYCAWKQWMSAKLLRKQVNDLLRKNPAKYRSHSAWTMTHAFYAGMGGFAFEVNDETDFVRKETGQARIPLTARGVHLLARCGHLPNISEEFILDKSKADALAKTLVCVQAGWCLLQYIGRLAGDLPVSLLELNTLGHALCAFAIYLSWWYKPLDIKEPYVLSGDWVAPLCAYMWMSSRISPCTFKDNRNLKTELSHLAWHRARCGDATKSSVDGVENDKAVTLSQRQTLFGFSFSLHSTIFQLRERKQIVWAWRSPFRYQIKRTDITTGPTVDLSIKDVRRWRLASNAINQYDGVMKDRVQAGGRLYVEELLDVPISNWNEGGLISGAGFASTVTLVFISMAYGGLHASAWNHFFSTWQERLLWRVSSLMIVGAGSISSLLLLQRKIRLIRYALDWILDILEWLPDWIVGGISIPLFLAFGIAYCLCRIFLVVEAFVGLRELPAGVYITPSWSQLLPHL